MIIRGRAVKYGDHVDTDVILPGKYLVLSDPEELAKHAMEGLDPTFPQKAKEGVILVAGRNFGCGSSREQAPLALKHAGVRCLVVESSARIFFRNAINLGLPVLECPRAREIEEGDELEVDLRTGEVVDLTRSLTLRARSLPDFLLEVIEDGGLIEHLRRRLAARRA